MQLEKAIQNNATVLLESIMHNHDSSFRIYEQKQSTQYKQLDSFLISDDVIIDNHTYRGVRSAIRIINATMQVQHQWNDQEFDSVVGQIAEYVTQTVDNYRNTKEPGYRLYCLMFDKQSKERICDVMVNDKKLTVEFQLFHFSDYTKNMVNIVREKRLPYLNIQKNEYPDFTVYINGIPVMNIEYKTKYSTLHQGVVDFCHKKTYQAIPFYGVSNGDDFLLMTNLHNYNQSIKNGASDFRWVEYDPIKVNPNKTNTEHFYEEIFGDLNNFFFYLTQCTEVGTIEDPISKNTVRAIKNARIQQYYALKAQKELVVALNAKNVQKPFNRLVVHTQRSGKTITMKMSANLWLDSKHFHKIFIFVPDLQIKRVLSNELKNNHKTVVEVATRAGLNAIIQDLHKTNHQTIYLVNMQKLDEEMMANTVYNGDDVLLIVDEAHHGQNGEQAKNRLATFPKASTLLFTATPKDATFRDYLGDDAEAKVLDMFTYSHAKHAGIVNNVIYQKMEREAFYDAGQLLAIDADVRYRWAVQNNMDVADVQLDNIQFAETLYTVLKERDDYHLAKLKAIIHNFKHVRQSYVNELGQQAFHGKGIVYVDSIKDAERYMTLVKDYANLHGTPYCFEGVRCALDHSGMDDDASLTWNGVDKASIDTYVQSQQTLRFDLLFAVDKYQKGYDLKELVVVYLDKKINEPSLINQIYTRPATKRADKSVGYCVDLHNNQDVLQESFNLYDQDRAGILGLFDEATIHGLEVEVDETQQSLEKVMQLPKYYTISDILDKLLNEPDISLRATYQELFFVKIAGLIGRIVKVESPLYFQKQKPFLTLIRQTMENLWLLLDRGDARILYRTDKEDKSNTTQIMSREDMLKVVKQSIADILDSDIFKVINIQYKKAVTVAPEQASVNELQQKILNEHRVDTLKMFRQSDGFAFCQNINLRDAIEKILSKITESPSAVHNCDIQRQILDIQKELEEAKRQEQQHVDEQFDKDYLHYALTMMLTQACGAEYDFKNEMKPLATKLNHEILRVYPSNRSIIDIPMMWNLFEHHEQPAALHTYIKNSMIMAINANESSLRKRIESAYTLQTLCENAMAYIQP